MHPKKESNIAYTVNSYAIELYCVRKESVTYSLPKTNMKIKGQPKECSKSIVMAPFRVLHDLEAGALSFSIVHVMW